MPADEGDALHAAALDAARAVPGAPLVEIGSYCGRSTIWLAAAAREAGTVVFAVDHHRGSEENQAGWEHHDPDVVDRDVGRIDTLPAVPPSVVRGRTRTTTPSPSSASRRSSPPTGRLPPPSSSSTAGTASSRPGPTTPAGRRTLPSGARSPSTTCSPTRPTAAARPTRTSTCRRSRVAASSRFGNRVVACPSEGGHSVRRAVAVPDLGGLRSISRTGRRSVRNPHRRPPRSPSGRRQLIVASLPAIASRTRSRRPLTSADVIPVVSIGSST